MSLPSIQANGYQIYFGDSSYQALNQLLVDQNYTTIFILVDSHTNDHCAPRFLTELATEIRIELIEIKPDKMPVGKHDRDQEGFTAHTIDINEGDIIYTLTDGFPDQFGGDKGKKFMSKNLKDLLLANAHLPMQQQKELLDNTFNNWVGDLEQVDDVTLIGIKI